MVPPTHVLSNAEVVEVITYPVSCLFSALGVIVALFFREFLGDLTQVCLFSFSQGPVTSKGYQAHQQWLKTVVNKSSRYKIMKVNLVPIL